MASQRAFVADCDCGTYGDRVAFSGAYSVHCGMCDTPWIPFDVESELAAALKANDESRGLDVSPLESRSGEG